MISLLGLTRLQPPFELAQVSAPETHHFICGELSISPRITGRLTVTPRVQGVLTVEARMEGRLGVNECECG